MAINPRGSKRAVESILVTKGDAALKTVSTALTDANGNISVADGQIGVINPATSVTLPVGATKANTPFIKFVQGTPTSANVPSSSTYPFVTKPYEASAVIDTAKVHNIYAQPYSGPTSSLTVVGADSGAGVIVPLDKEKYTLTLGFRGRRQDEYESSLHNIPVMTVEYNTPDYTTLGTVSPLDSLVQNVVYQINKNSRAFGFNLPSYGGNLPVLAFAVNSAGGSGVAITDAVGTVIPVVTVSGFTRNYVITQDLFDTLAAAVTAGALLNTATIEVVDLSTAGAAANADQIVIVALDETTAYEDRTPFVKVRIDVGAGEAFASTLTLVKVGSKAYEGQGTYRQWNIFYKNTAGQRKYSQYRGFEAIRVDYPSPIVANEKYSALIFEHYDANQVSFAGTSNSPQKTIILVPNGDTTTKTALQTFVSNFFGVTVVL